MNESARHISHIAVVGGGTAGWLAACRLAVDHAGQGVRVTLVESPDVPIIGVGEGTWPSMRQTLKRIGLSERVLLERCQATFKQGTRFNGWRRDDGTDTYYHPFSLPAEYTRLNPARGWLAAASQRCFADTVTPQISCIEAGLGPKTDAMPDYAFVLNYAYHFDAGRFAELLQQYATETLGVHHMVANVTDVRLRGEDQIESLMLGSDTLEADLYIDCTGQRRLLRRAVGGLEFEDVSPILFNDSALAVQIPYSDPEEPIASSTIATAHDVGWIWDIGLGNRRGVGCVFASAYADEEAARAHLAHYVGDGLVGEHEVRLLRFDPGYDRTPWVGNCVAIGLSAGFVEPLEASAIALVEQAVSAISEDLPASQDALAVVAGRFNTRMRYHWARIVEFLKLHYVLSERSTPYWAAHRDDSTWPEGLRENMVMWNQRPPYHDDAPLLKELFPSASLQFVLYGMGFKPQFGHADMAAAELQEIDRALHAVAEQKRSLASTLPAHRALLSSLLSSRNQPRN